MASAFIRNSKVELLTLDLAMADENHTASTRLFFVKKYKSDTLFSILFSAVVHKEEMNLNPWFILNKYI